MVKGIKNYYFITVFLKKLVFFIFNTIPCKFVKLKPRCYVDKKGLRFLSGENE